MKADWKKRMMDMAWHVSSWSKDSSTKVGCVITDKENTIKSLGYNGHPRGLNDEVAERNERPLKYLYVVHAEINAIANATRNGVSLKDSIMYCTFFPCNECAKAIINSGIKTIVTYEPDFSKGRWAESFRISLEMLEECGVKIKYFFDEHDEFYFNLPPFKDENCAEWDYEGREKFGRKTDSRGNPFFDDQNDWNQTLITTINQMDANIHQQNLKGAGNKIRINSQMFPLISTLAFFKGETMTVENRYKVIIDENIPKNKILVYYDGKFGASSSKESDFKFIKILNYKS